MMSRRDFLHGSVGATAVGASAIHGVERADAAEPTAAYTPTASDRAYAVRPDIHPDLKRHGAIFEKKIQQVGDHVYSAIGFADGNSVMVVWTPATKRLRTLN